MDLTLIMHFADPGGKETICGLPVAPATTLCVSSSRALVDCKLCQRSFDDRKAASKRVAALLSTVRQ
jgi:hypothetical protein